MKNRCTTYACILLIMIMPLSSTIAQATNQDLSPNRPAQYFLGDSNELLVPVNIWGFVEKPGQYMVPHNTDLISLMSYAGGPKEGAKISSVKIVRSDAQRGNRVFNINVKEYLDSGNPQLIPILRPGDTVIVKGSTFNWIQKFLSFLSSLVVFAQIVYFIAIANDYSNRD